MSQTNGARDPHGDTPETAFPVQADVPVRGRAGAAGDPGDYFTFVAPAAGLWRFAIDQVRGDADIEIEDIVDVPPFIIDNLIMEGPDRPEWVVAFADAGESILIEVEPDFFEDGVVDYRLTVAAEPENDAPARFETANVLVSGDSVAQSVGIGADRADVFRYVAPEDGAGQILRLFPAFSSETARLEVRDSDGMRIMSLSAFGEVPLAPGEEVFLRIIGGGAPGAYRLDLDSQAATVGTQAADRLNGSDGGDLIFGRGGQDRISGGAGVDILHGNDGADRLRGGDAPDDLYGGAGADTMAGGSGNDRLFGGDGNDRLTGGEGLDSLWGAAGADLLDLTESGGAWDEVVFGGLDDSRLGNGDSILGFQSGRDLLNFRPLWIVLDKPGGGGLGFSPDGPAAWSVWFKDLGDDIRVRADLTGDGRPDFEVVLIDQDRLVANDLLL